MSSSRRVILGDLPLSERERFYEFLVANKIEFIADQTGQQFVATIRVVPPEPSTARLTGRSRTSAKAAVRADSAPASKQSARMKQAAATINHAPIQDAATTLKAAQSVLRRRYTRFCNLVPTLQAAPKVIRRTALVRFADEIYDARYERDALTMQSEAEGQSRNKQVQTFPDFVYDFVSKRYGLKALLSNYCWGMISSVELMRTQSDSIEIFGKFLEESYDSVDLLFYLFLRSVINRVLEYSKGKTEEERGDSDSEEETEGKEHVKKKDSKYVPKEVKMEPPQIRKAINIALANNVRLRDKINGQLFSFMDERMVEPGSKAVLGLDPNFVLKIAVDAYHQSREVSEDEKRTEIKRQSQKAEGDAQEEGSLAPELRKEVRQVSQRLVSNLSAAGVADVNPQMAYEWALAVTLRRHKVGDYLERAADNISAMTLDEIKKEALQLVAEPTASAPVDSFVTADEVLGLSAREFEENLESNVRQLLLNAVSELVAEAISSLHGSVGKDEKACAVMRSILIKEYASTADILMETIVSKDYKKWLDTLQVESGGSAKQRQQFEKLHDEFTQVLNSDITAEVVQKVCRDVVRADELYYAMVRNRAADLARLAEANKLSGLAADEDEPALSELAGTASFGEDN